MVLTEQNRGKSLFESTSEKTEKCNISHFPGHCNKQDIFLIMAVIFLTALDHVKKCLRCVYWWRDFAFLCNKSRGELSVAGHPEPTEAEDVSNEGSAEHLCYLADGNLFLPTPCHLSKAFPV